MTVKFNIVERCNPGNPNAPKKYYPSVQSTGRKNLRQLSKRIMDISTVGRSDVLAVLDAMLYVIPEELAEGNIVELGDFGTFWLRINGEGQESARKIANPKGNPLPLVAIPALKQAQEGTTTGWLFWKSFQRRRFGAGRSP